MAEMQETPFRDEAGFRAALDRVIAVARHEIRIFDYNLERMMLDEKARAEALGHFLAESPARRLHIVLHHPDHAETRCPRLLTMIRQFPERLQVRETPLEFKHLTEGFLLADQSHGVIRFHHDQARGKLLLDAAETIHPWWQRADELWRGATPCLAPTQLGL